MRRSDADAISGEMHLYLAEAYSAGQTDSLSWLDSLSSVVKIDAPKLRTAREQMVSLDRSLRGRLSRLIPCACKQVVELKVSNIIIN